MAIHTLNAVVVECDRCDERLPGEFRGHRDAEQAILDDGKWNIEYVGEEYVTCPSCTCEEARSHMFEYERMASPSDFGFRCYRCGEYRAVSQTEIAKSLNKIKD